MELRAPAQDREPRAPLELVGPPVPKPALKSAPLPKSRPAALTRKPSEPPVGLPAPRLTGQACQEQLARLGARFEPISPIRTGRCGIGRPLRLTRVPPGIDLLPPATVNCPTALLFARYARDSIAKNARAVLGKRLERLRVAASYVCRSRNRRAGAKLSEHALGNAIDISIFTFADGSEFAVAPRAGSRTREARFQRAIRRDACRYFTTVLGPGSDGYHKDHLHMDRRQRRGDYRICR